MFREQASAVRSKFDVGARIRVKFGVKDPDFPENDLGDFRGTIAQVERGKTAYYLIDWDPATLDRLCPACHDFCKFEDIAFDKMWLLADDLEPDPAVKKLPRKLRVCTVG